MAEAFRTGVLPLALCAAILTGCAYDGRSLKPGQSTLQDVRATMGEPAMQWANADHSAQLSYPRGPSGYQSYMVYLDPSGRLERIDDVMGPASFDQIKPGMTEGEVLRILGPPVPEWTNYFEARRELVWEWSYCNEFSQRARFDVLFDGDRRTVRTTVGRAELCNNDSCLCPR